MLLHSSLCPGLKGKMLFRPYHCLVIMPFLVPKNTPWLPQTQDHASYRLFTSLQVSVCKNILFDSLNRCILFVFVKCKCYPGLVPHINFLSLLHNPMYDDIILQLWRLKPREVSQAVIIKLGEVRLRSLDSGLTKALSMATSRAHTDPIVYKHKVSQTHDSLQGPDQSLLFLTKSHSKFGEREICNLKDQDFSFAHKLSLCIELMSPWSAWFEFWLLHI